MSDASRSGGSSVSELDSVRRDRDSRRVLCGTMPRASDTAAAVDRCRRCAPRLELTPETRFIPPQALRPGIAITTAAVDATGRSPRTPSTAQEMPAALNGARWSGCDRCPTAQSKAGWRSRVRWRGGLARFAGGRIGRAVVARAVGRSGLAQHDAGRGGAQRRRRRLPREPFRAGAASAARNASCPVGRSRPPSCDGGARLQSWPRIETAGLRSCALATAYSAAAVSMTAARPAPSGPAVFSGRRARRRRRIRHSVRELQETNARPMAELTGIPRHDRTSARRFAWARRAARRRRGARPCSESRF